MSLWQGRRVHRVGLTMALLGGVALLLLTFVTVSPSRIATGVPRSALSALGTGLALALAAPWLVVAAASVRRVGRSFALARGIAAGSVVLVSLALAERAAVAALGELGPFARVSIGGGVWLSAFAAYAVVLASRRELGISTPLAWVVALLAPIGIVVLAASGSLDHLGVMVEYHNIEAEYWVRVTQHIGLAAAAIGFALVIGLALGVLAFVSKRARRPVFSTVNLFQTIPGLALIALLIAPFSSFSRALPFVRQVGFGGLGWAPVVFALTLYALLPIVRNTYAGLSGVPAETIEAGHGMGMTDRQVLRKVRLPIAAPVLFSGLRTSSEQTVGNATLGAVAAAGGLGVFVFGGLAAQAPDLIILGSISIVALALLVDGSLRAVEALARPGRKRARPSAETKPATASSKRPGSVRGDS